MIYLKNNTETQTIFIPREAVSGGELINIVKGYDAGVEDGIKIGEQRQKEKLTNLYVTESGVYDDENGYDVVTVAIDGGECPEISLEKGHFTASENGEYVITPTEGFDGLESLNLMVDVPQEGGNCNLVGGNLNHPIGEDSPIFDASQYGYDGFEWLGVRSIYNNEWQRVRALVDAYNSTEQITIDQNGTYSNADYRGTSYIVKNFLWFSDIIPTEETDVELWVKPLAAENYWAGFIGSQNNDDDPTTFQIRRIGLQNEFEFRFGDQTFEHPFEEGKWYRLRMNKWGVWVNGEQVREWEVNNYVSPDYALAINGIENPNWENWDDFYRVNYAEYGYVYFHNLGTLLTPDYSSAIFLFNNGHKIQYGNNRGSINVNYYSGSLGYNKIDVNVPQEGGNGDCECNIGDLRINFEDLDGTGRWWRGASADGFDGYDYVEINASEYGDQKYNQGYQDGQANCEGGGETSCTLEHLSVTENGWYEPKAQEFGYLVVNENSAFDTGVKLVDNTTIEIYFNTGSNWDNIPTLVGCEDADWNNTTFAVRWFGGNLAVKIGTQEINIPLGAEDEVMKFHKLKFGRYEGVWLDDNYIEPFYDTEWIMPQNTIYIGAMHNTTNGDANGVWRPWNGYIGNVKIYGEKNGEVRDFTFTCGDFGRWGEYETADYGILPNLMGDGGATFNCCKQYGDAPFDGYRSVDVNIDVESYKEEGRNEIRNGLKTLSVNETGVFDINETFVKEVFVMNNAKIVGAKSSDNWENIKIRFASYTLTPEHEWLEIQHLFRLSNGLEINFHGGGIRVENSEQGNLPYNFYPNFNEVEVTNNSFRVNDQIQYFDYDLFEGADYNIWLGNMRETIISVELNGISLSKDDFTIQEGSIENRVLDFKKFEGEGWNKVDVNVTPKIRNYEGVKFGHSTFTDCPFNIDEIGNYDYMFFDCKRLVNAPIINAPISSAVSMFSGCESLVNGGDYDTSNATDLGEMYGGCRKLQYVGRIDCSSLPNREIGWGKEAQIFDTSQYAYLTDFGGFINLKQIVNLKGLISLNEQSVINIFNGLYNFVGNNETPNTIQGKITMSRFITDIVEAHKSIAENKGWTITIE